MAQLESMLRKRSGVSLPSTHHIMLDLKTELCALYGSDSKVLQNGNIENINKRLEFTKEQLAVLNTLEGNQTDSRLKGNFALSLIFIILHCCGTKAGLKENPLLFYIHTFPLSS